MRTWVIWIGAAAMACSPGGSSHPAEGTTRRPEPRSVLIARINQSGDVNDPQTPIPLVTLEEFFEGNDDYGSIGYNFYPDQPAPAEFYALFSEIRSKPNVVDVRVQVSQHDDPDGWPVSDTIWVFTSASEGDVRSWLGERFSPDELLSGFPSHFTYEQIDVPAGNSAIGVWWD